MIFFLEKILSRGPGVETPGAGLANRDFRWNSA